MKQQKTMRKVAAKSIKKHLHFDINIPTYPSSLLINAKGRYLFF
jgi:hypothetical protein